MADSSDGASSWPGLFAYLNKTFDLLRDIFGYALPGLVFFSIGVASRHFSIQSVHDLIAPFELTEWGMLLLGAAACYAMGHILIMLAYLPIDIRKVWLHWRGRDEELARIPTEVIPTALVVQRRHPEFFDVWGRRETMAMAEAGLGMALLLGGGYFYFLWSENSFRWVLLIGGMLLLFDFGTGIQHLRRVRAAIIQADKDIKTELNPGEYERAILDLLKQSVSAQKDGAAGRSSGESPGLIQSLIALLQRRD